MHCTGTLWKLNLALLLYTINVNKCISFKQNINSKTKISNEKKTQLLTLLFDEHALNKNLTFFAANLHK